MAGQGKREGEGQDRYRRRQKKANGEENDRSKEITRGESRSCIYIYLPLGCN